MQVGLYPRWHGVLPETGSFVPSWPPAPRRMAEAAAEFKALPWWNEFTPAYREHLERLDDRYEVPDRRELEGAKFSFWQPIDLYQMSEGARARAEELGLNAVVLCGNLHAYSGPAAMMLAQVANECEMFGRPLEPPLALITGGHLDVPIGNATGVGGRNQEFSLVWGQALGGGPYQSKNVVVAAMDSDGTDGPGTQLVGGEYMCMAGGVTDGYTMEVAAREGVDVAAELANHNSTMALMKLKSAISTGNTGLCLGDLRVAVVRRRGASPK
jgi:glycerate-2-kinase